VRDLLADTKVYIVFNTWITSSAGQTKYFI